jgi:type IV secretion system protein VirD4
VIVSGVMRLGLAGVALAGIALFDGRRWVRRRTAASPGARWARRADLGRLAVPGPVPGRLVLGRAGRRLVAAEARHSVLVMGPTQSQKTSGFAIPALLEWRGPVVAASVKTDLVERTVSWRRSQGRVWVYDPSGCTGVRSSPWSPLVAAGTWEGARRLAHALTDAARPAAGSLADVDFWYGAAAKLLAPLLLAAALSGRTMADVVRWLDEQDQVEVADALFAAGPDATVALRAAKATWGRDDRQRSAVYATAEMVVEAFVGLPDTPPGPDGPIDPAALIDAHHTLYLCAPTHEQRRLRPLFCALTTAVLDTAFARSARSGEALDPPLLVVLDESAHIAPLAELDTLAATAASHGVQLVTVWQDLAQLNARYGARTGTVVNNHRVKVFLSGIADPVTLEHASALIGDTEHRQRTVTLDGRGGRSRTEAPIVRRLAPPDALRRMRPGSAVVVSGHLPPIRLRLRPWWREPELRRRAHVAPVVPEMARVDGPG